jgi:ABC-type Na+ efflux pump permease subunit
VVGLLLVVLLQGSPHQSALGDSTATNSTGVPSSTSTTSSTTVTFDFMTAGVVSFVLVLLGLAGGLALSTKLSRPSEEANKE